MEVLSDCNSRGSSLDKSPASSLSDLPPKVSSSSSTVEAELQSLWGSDQEWILIFDKLLKHPNGKPKKGCKCDLCEAQKPSVSPYAQRRRRQTVAFQPEIPSQTKPKKLSEPSVLFAPGESSLCHCQQCSEGIIMNLS